MLKDLLRILPLFVGLWGAPPATAQERVATPSQKTKEAVEQVKTAPEKVGKTLQALGKAVGAKLGFNSEEIKDAKSESEKPAAARAEKQDSESTAPVVPTVKRDPFRPFTIDRPSERRRRDRSPLERYELGQLKLVGVIWDIKQPNAIVEDAAGLGYVVKTGTPIGANEGKVKRIDPAGLVIEEFEIDLFGSKKRVERNMRLATEKAE